MYYKINQSPFYKLSNKKKLLNIIFMSNKEFKSIVLNNDLNYIIRNIIDKKGKQRIVEEPKKFLKRIHTRIKDLLSSIEVPEYLHSAIKKHSYLTNALSHVGKKSLLKTDISNFYPSNNFYKVYNFFKNKMLCSEDIAVILAKISTFQGHIPTGSPLSPILSFLVNQDMFNEINKIAVSNNCKFTLYVDDLTFSGKGCFKFSREVIHIINKYGFLAKNRKTKKYLENQVKLVTGIIIKNDCVDIPNERYKRVRKLKEIIENEKNKGIVKISNIRKYIGCLSEIARINKKYKKDLKSFTKSFDFKKNIFKN